MKNKFTCLSLFDGISAAQQAFKNLGIEFDGVNNMYLVSEIDPYAIKVTQKNFPNTIQLGAIYPSRINSFMVKLTGRNLKKIMCLKIKTLQLRFVAYFKMVSYLCYRIMKKIMPIISLFLVFLFINLKICEFWNINFPVWLAGFTTLFLIISEIYNASIHNSNYFLMVILGAVSLWVAKIIRNSYTAWCTIEFHGLIILFLTFGILLSKKVLCKLSIEAWEWFKNSIFEHRYNSNYEMLTTKKI